MVRRQHRHSHQQDARTFCWMFPIIDPLRKASQAFLLHSQIVSYAVALVKQLLVDAGNRCRPGLEMFEMEFPLVKRDFWIPGFQKLLAANAPGIRSVSPVAPPPGLRGR